MRQAIVSGATGFIGSVLVSTLLQLGVQVVALGRKPWSEIPTLRQDKLSGSSYLQLDMANISKLNDGLARQHINLSTDCVFYNLAWWGKERVSDQDVRSQLANVSQGLAALTTCSELGVKRFIQVGSMEEEFARLYLQLDHRKHTYYNRHLIYGLAKLTARRALFQKSLDLPIDFIYAINPYVIGPDDDKDSFLQVTLQKLLSQESLSFSSGEQLFDVIDVVDCARAYESIGRLGRRSASYWVGSGRPRPLKEYVEEMYSLYPSGQPMNFGAAPFNDVKLDESVFCNKSLLEDTDFSVSVTFKESVRRLRDSLA